MRHFKSTIDAAAFTQPGMLFMCQVLHDRGKEPAVCIGFAGEYEQYGKLCLYGFKDSIDAAIMLEDMLHADWAGRLRLADKHVCDIIGVPEHEEYVTNMSEERMTAAFNRIARLKNKPWETR